MKDKRYVKHYNISNVVFSIETPVVYNDSNYYSLFLTEDNNTKIKYLFHMVDALPHVSGISLFQNDYIKIVQQDEEIYRFVGYGQDRGYYACTVFSKNDRNVSVQLINTMPKLWGGVVFESIGLEHLLNQNNRMILHSAYICVNGEAVLFTAPSGTGKTTQAKLWEQHKNAEIINGDRVCLSVDNDIVMAHGIPIAGTSRICKNRSMKVRAIVVLEQANENTIECLSEIKAFQKLYSETWVNDWIREDVTNVANLIGKIITNVPIVLLRCLPTQSAVELLAKHIL